MKIMYNIVKKMKLGRKGMIKTLTLTITLLVFSSIIVFASYPYDATMDSTRGFNKGNSRGKIIMYYQYGAMNWRSNVDFAVNQINNNPAAVSCYYGSSYSSADIVASSNYWYDVPWSGSSNGTKSLSPKTVLLNSASKSAQSNSPWLCNGIATHELTHIWGVMDCENPDSIMCGYDDTRQVNTITDDVTTLLKNRY